MRENIAIDTLCQRNSGWHPHGRSHRRCHAGMRSGILMVVRTPFGRSFRPGGVRASGTDQA
jgi:hypothetical protein